MNDIIFVTVDCWRHDALPEMERLWEETAEHLTDSVVCQAPATRGAFPALLCGQYYPQTYDGFDTLAGDVRPLPEVLSERGYATGAVVASNPFLSVWEPFFDSFWNDGLDFGSDDGADGRVAGYYDTAKTLASYARLQSRVPARRAIARGRRWYEAQSSPRFLWIHLMDSHAPFLPGIRRTLSEGLVDTYAAHAQFRRDPHDLSAAEHETLERLYWQSVRRLDEQIDAVFDIDPDASTVFVGDHGEEFDHDRFGHARLYEECVRVPLLASPDIADQFDRAGLVRQLDVPAGILAAVGADQPDSWEDSGTPTDPVDTAFSLNHSPQFERVYAAVRTERYKLIRTFDERVDRPLRTELYDLVADPGETEDLFPDERRPALEEKLDTFLDRPDIRPGLLERPTRQSAVVEDRLTALGYK
jgi:arylsulfatase A-like enzyme